MADGADEAPEFFSPALGEKYDEFWNRTAATDAGALLGVGGYPFGRPPTETSLTWQGLPVARFIAEHLDLQLDDDVLEVGVGVGRLAQHLAPLVNTYHGADVSAYMLMHAARRLREVDNLHLHHLQSSDLRSLHAESFDKVFFQHVLIHLDPEDQFNYIREARRVLRPGGVAYLQFYNLLHERGFAEYVHAADQVILQGGRQRGAVRCQSAEEIRYILTQAGFRVLEDRSHLEKIQQRFQWIPDRDWEFYLIAVCARD